MTAAIRTAIAFTLILTATCWADQDEQTKSRFVQKLDGGEAQTIVVYGTSLTAGGAWRKQLAALLTERYGEKAVFKSGASSGKDSNWGVANLEQRVLTHKPDALFIEFAMNDAIASRGTSVDKARKNLESMIDTTLKVLPDCEIILMSMNPDLKHLVLNRKRTGRPHLARYYAMYADVAKQRELQFIDIHAEWVPFLGKDVEKIKKHIPDGVHPNALGARTVIVPTILKNIGVPTAADAPKQTNGANMSKKIENAKLQPKFDKVARAQWKQVFTDPCTGDWKKQWFLDGEVAKVTTGADGMALTAGPEWKNDAHHMVLWTKQEFKGDLKIEWEFTRLDEEQRGVNILYIQATGSGKGELATDITKWNKLRKVPAMRTYFNNMNTYHISYAANVDENDKSYIRGRRYMPHKTGLKGTDLDPDYWPAGLFKTGVKHHITVIKTERNIHMRVENAEQVYYCHMANPKLPVITEGRIGLRLMFTRSSRFENIRISVPAKGAE